MLIECVLVCLVAVVVLLWYSGLFTSIDVSVTRSPTVNDAHFTIAYKLYTGSYSRSYRGFKELKSLIGSDRPTIGIYYDDPKKVPSKQCRYVVGAIVEDGHETYLTDNYTRHLANWGYTTVTLPPLGRSIVCSFPHTTPLSLMIGAMRVYPKINSSIQDPEIIKRMRMAIEFYWNDAKIQYCFPLENTDAYLVAELK